MFAFIGLAIGQDAPEEAKNIEIIRSDSSSLNQEKNRVIQRLNGNVQLKLDSIYFYCDSAIIDNDERILAYGNIVIQQTDSISAFADSLDYDAIEKLAILMGDTVVLVNGEQELYTDQLNYYLDQKLATYFSGATMYRGETQLSSKVGYYYVEPDVIYFRDSVIVIDPEFNLRTDTLQFDVNTKTVYFIDSTLITSDTNRIYCEGGYYNTEIGFAEFTDNAQFKRGEQVGKADVIQYDQERNNFFLIGNAWIQAPGQLAEADTIDYNEQTSVFILSGNATFKDEERFVQSTRILYDDVSKTYSTNGRSYISEPPSILEADRVDFKEETGLGFAYGGVIWRDTSADLTIFCDTAEYNREEDYLKAIGGRLGRPFMLTLLDGDSLFLAADTLFAARADYFEKLKLQRAMAKDSIAIDSTLDEMTSDSILAATTMDQDSSLRSGMLDSIDMAEKSQVDSTVSEVKLSVFPMLPAKQLKLIELLKVDPLQPPKKKTKKPAVPDKKRRLLNNKKDFVPKQDSIPIPDSIGLDTTTMELGVDSLGLEEDTTRYLIAYNDVRIFKNDLQALCDSLSFNSADSIFTFFKNPVIWSDTSQLSGDTVRILLRNSAIDRAFLDQKAIIIKNTKEGFFNQIKGKFITAFFRDDDINRMLVEGNAESIYYAQDEQGGYIGVNKTVSSEMLIYFKNNEIDKIRFLRDPQGTADPMGEADHNSLRLDGFKWLYDLRPKSLEDLFTPKSDIGSN